MKNIIKLLLPLIVVMSACEDMLEEKVEDRFVPSEVFVNETGAYHYMIGMYGNLIAFQNYKEHTNMLPMLADGLAPTGGRYKEFLRSRMNGNVGSLNAAWAIRHTMANMSNLALLYLPDAEMPEARKTEFEGHAYFMRGQGYLELFRWFGRAIVKTDPTLSGDDVYRPLSTPEKTIDQVISDFKAAAERLPLKSEQLTNYKGLATKGAAQAYLAKAYMERASKISGADANADYTEALRLVNEVINSNQYALLDDYAEIFDVENQDPGAALGSGNAYEEIIFAVAFEHWGPGRIVETAGNDLPARFWPFPAPYTASNTGGQQQVTVQKWWYDYYHAGDYDGDYRNETNYVNSFTHKQNGSTVVGYPLAGPGNFPQFQNWAWVGKYKDPAGLNVRTHSNDFILIRLADLYLMKAELLNELNGPTQEAIDAINIVRERARNGGTAPADLVLANYSSKEELRRQILDERGQELFAEGHRLYDLLRMKRDDGTTYYEYMIDPANGWIASTYPGDKYTLLEFNSRDLLMPIPQGEMVNNPLLSESDQNMGW